MSIEQYRRNYAMEIRATIGRLEKTQQREKETIKCLGGLGIPVEIATKKKRELEDAIQLRDIEISELQKKLKNVELGAFDEKIQGELNKGKAKAKIINDNIQKKSKQKVIDDEERKQKFRNSDRERNNPEKDYFYFFKQFCKIDESLPDYIRQNLSDMPNNKGYVWRGCWFLGDKDPEKPFRGRSVPIIIFEKLRGGTLRIHEYEDYEYRMYEKQGKDKRQLILQKPRQVKTQGKLRL